MRSPSRRYGNNAEFAFWIRGIPLQAVAKDLMRDTRTVRDWASGRRRVPYWVPELLRLRAWAREDVFRQMGPSVYDAFVRHEVARFSQVVEEGPWLRTGTDG